MAGGTRNGQRSSDQQRRGGEDRREKQKRKRSLALESRSRGGEERGPKIRKVMQEEMGGKLQFTERDKSAKAEKTRRPEEEKKLVAAGGSAVDTTEKERKIAFLKSVLEPSYGCVEDIPDYLWPFFEGGADAVKRINDNMRLSVKEFKEFAAAILKMEFNIQV